MSEQLYCTNVGGSCMHDNDYRCDYPDFCEFAASPYWLAVTFHHERAAIEKESRAIQNRLTERPQMFSEYGLAYWKGNVEALKWVLTKMADIHLEGGAKT